MSADPIPDPPNVTGRATVALTPEAQAALAAIERAVRDDFKGKGLASVAARVILERLRDGINETRATDPSALFYWTKETLLEAARPVWEAANPKRTWSFSMEQNFDQDLVRIGDRLDDLSLSVPIGDSTFTVRFLGPTGSRRGGVEPGLIYFLPVITRTGPPAQAVKILPVAALVGPPLRPTANADRQGQVPPEVEPGRPPDQVQPLHGKWIDGDIEIYRHDAAHWQFLVRTRSIRTLRDADIRWDWIVRTGTTEQRVQTYAPVLFMTFDEPPPVPELSVTVTASQELPFRGELGFVGVDEVVLIDSVSRAPLTPPARDLIVNYDSDDGPRRLLVGLNRPGEVLPLPPFDRCGRFAFEGGGGSPALGVAWIAGAPRHLAVVVVPARRDGFGGAVSIAFGDGCCEYGVPRIPAALNGNLPPELRVLPAVGADHRYDGADNYLVALFLATNAGPLEIVRATIPVP